MVSSARTIACFGPTRMSGEPSGRVDLLIQRRPNEGKIESVIGSSGKSTVVSERVKRPAVQTVNSWWVSALPLLLTL